MPAYVLWGRSYEFEDTGLGSCWINRNDQCAYTLDHINGDGISFRRGDGAVLTLAREDAERCMAPT